MKSAVFFKNIFIIVVFMSVLCFFVSGSALAQRPIIREAEAIITHDASEGERIIILEPAPFEEGEFQEGERIDDMIIDDENYKPMPLIAPNPTDYDIGLKGYPEPDIVTVSVTSTEVLPRPTDKPMPMIPADSAVIGIEEPWNMEGYTSYDPTIAFGIDPTAAFSNDPMGAEIVTNNQLIAPAPLIAPNPLVTPANNNFAWTFGNYNPTVAFNAGFGTNQLFRTNSFNFNNINAGYNFINPLSTFSSSWTVPSFSSNNLFSRFNNTYKNSNQFQGFVVNNPFNFSNTFQYIKPVTPSQSNEPVTISQGTLDPQAGDENLTKGAVYISETDILLLESYPVQVKLDVLGQLPTPCHELRAIVYEPDNQNKIQIELYSLVDPDIFCIQVMEDFEISLSLGNYTDGAYTVSINGEKVNQFNLNNQKPTPVSPQFNIADLNLDESYHGDSVVVSEGETLSIVLPSNATTGYKWELNTDLLDTQVINLQSTRYITDLSNPGLVGVGGNEQLIFQTTGDGTTIIELNYTRSWSSDIADTFWVEVTVEAANVLGGGQIGLANPASVYCIENGGELEMRENDLGVYGVCMFSDGTECEEWAFFRGECN